MTNPTARAIATVGASASCAAIGWAEPVYGIMALVALVLTTAYIWKDA